MKVIIYLENTKDYLNIVQFLKSIDREQEVLVKSRDFSNINGEKYYQLVGKLLEQYEELNTKQVYELTNCKKSYKSTQRWLETLTKEGLLLKRKSNNKNYYRLAIKEEIQNAKR